jgi:hypothetical protein
MPLHLRFELVILQWSPCPRYKSLTEAFIAARQALSFGSLLP